MSSCVIKLQDIQIENQSYTDDMRNMFYRSEQEIFHSESGYVFPKGTYDFSTWFNALFVSQWKEGTYASGFMLEMDLKGRAVIELNGYHINHSGVSQCECFGKYYFHNRTEEHICLEYPMQTRSTVYAFRIMSEQRDTIVSNACYTAYTEKVNPVSLGIAAPNSVDKKDTMFHFSTLKKEISAEISDHIFLLAERTDGLTHILRFERDGLVFADTISRLYIWLSLQKDSDVAINGTLLDIDDRSVVANNQPEDQKTDLNSLEQIIEYADGLPKMNLNPFFSCASASLYDYHEDYWNDEHEITAITLNGICMWCENRLDTMSKDRYVLQKIELEINPQSDEMHDMFYRSNSQALNERGGKYLLRDDFFDFSTYFNSLSLEKWKTYTIAKNFFLELDIQGRFTIELMGHFVNKNNEIQKEWLGVYDLNCNNRKRIRLKYPDMTRTSVVAFQIRAYGDVYFYGGCYSAELESDTFRQPQITLATTTFKKEDYLLKNVEILNRELFTDTELRDHFTWKIIDNGRTLDVEAINNDYIEVLPNRNVGGSGGFTRGIMEAWKQDNGTTNVLLMDDDVLFYPESFKRVYHLLNLMREEYLEYYICGAMLEINQRNIQHEDIGMFRLNGEHGPSKPRYDLCLWDSVIRNEELIKEDPHQYCGWWYCCIPMTTARMDNLPLPFFIRGDDVEYSIRNHAKFITMNGVCIWHEGFGTKFSGNMEFYQVHRNDLILQAMNDHMQDVDVISRIKELFWQNMYMFNYKGASLLLDSVEDYLKGPDFIENLDGEQCMKEKKALDNVPLPMTDKVRKLVDLEKLYEWEPLPSMQKKIYDYTCNGQKRFGGRSKGKTGVIPYGWGYYQNNMCLTEKNYAIDPINETYVVYKKDKNKFKELESRYKLLFGRYERENEQITRAYKERTEKFHSEEFWEEYLK